MYVRVAAVQAVLERVQINLFPDKAVEVKYLRQNVHGEPDNDDHERAEAQTLIRIVILLEYLGHSLQQAVALINEHGLRDVVHELESKPYQLQRDQELLVVMVQVNDDALSYVDSLYN